ncbi:Glycosyl transferase domain-containing protein, family I [Desulfonema limicola]|uniref:Glycosyl transferase domain-containing protein, family I n=1 Tax=Desulfonema limicola TaxID=45656 RepID=A0A975BAB4_9BACT|nr:glycosyltransferase family 4 protein [Desulfonema limicola]QTA81901.1 Glycosyl transferase domain-containing protein, family I [Desulfonema limicola]
MADILTCYYRPKPGGFCKRLFRAVNALLADGHTVHYLAVVPFPIKHPNCHFHRFPWPEKKTENLVFWGFFHITAPLMLFFIACKYKINRAFCFGHTYSLLMQPLHLIKDIPQTLFLRADTIKNHEIKDRHKCLIALEKLFEGLAVFDVCLYGVSHSLTKNIFQRHKLLKPKYIGILPNDIKNLPESYSRKKYTLPLKFGAAGILEKRKNQKLLIEVMEKIRKDHAQLFIYGIGPQEEELRKLVQDKQLTEQIHFMGWAVPEQIWKNIDLLMMPSLHEGAPNAALEALSQGIPVIASSIPEHLEILPQDSLISNKSPYEWIDRLQKIIDNPDTELLKILSAQKPCAEKFFFNWDKKITNLIVM